MKKRLTFILVSLAVATGAQAQLVMKRTSSSTLTTLSYDYVYFSQNGTADEWSLGSSSTASYVSRNDISNIAYIATQAYLDNNVSLEDYVCPTYVDDYRSVSYTDGTYLTDWSNRDKWNLANVHDPTVMLASDGYYYMYQTDASYGNAHEGHGHFHGRRSTNLVDWEYLGATMDECPSWVLDSVNAIRTRLNLTKITDPSYGYWAPCARKVSDNLYRMYYSIVVDNYIGSGATNTTANFDNTWTERAYIGLMETSDPSDNSSWVDKGFVICSASDKGKDWSRSSTTDYNAYFKFNAIDPSYIITPEGEHWLVYGSWHSGIAAVQLDPGTGKTLAKLPEPYGTADDIAAYGTLIFTRDASSRWQGAEGPEVVYYNGYYYLFLAYDALDVAYNTRVLRSKSITGPYATYDGSVTNASEGAGDHPSVLTHPYAFNNSYGWVGISHCAVFDDGEGNWFYASQQRLPTTASGNAPNAVMLGGVRSIQWLSSNWPVVMPERYGAVPQETITSDEIAGTWEHIDIGYNYGTQKTASDMTFNSDGSITSSVCSGTWSFNSVTNILTISPVGLNLRVQREVDWELGDSDPTARKVTLVYSGLNGSECYWGKKKQE